MENRDRTIQKKFYLSEIENRMLERLMAEAKSPNFSSYARKRLLVPVVVNVDTDSFNQMVFQLNRIGNNLNQIAKVANQTKDINPQTLDDVVNLCKGLDRYVKRSMKAALEKLEEDYQEALEEKRRGY